MLKIAPSQMDGLVEIRRAAFVDHVRPILRAAHPVPTREMSDAEMNRLIEEGHRAAIEYGITADDDVESYLHLLFDLGPGFDRELPFCDVLARDDWSGHMRVALMTALHEGRFWDGPLDTPFSP